MTEEIKDSLNVVEYTIQKIETYCVSCKKVLQPKIVGL